MTVTKIRHAALVVRRDSGAAVHGPCWTADAAARVCTLIGMTDPMAWATHPIAITPPDADPLTDRAGYLDGGVIDVPDAVADTLLHHTRESTVDSGASVVLVVAACSPHHALVVGTFARAMHARTWVASRDSPGPEATTVMTCQVLPIAPPVDDITRLRAGDGVASLPGVVVVDLGDTQIVYGPFPDTVHASAYWHDITSVLRLTNVRAAHICPVYRAPRPYCDCPPAPSSTNTDGTTHKWVVILTSAQRAAPIVLGWFSDAAAAHAWTDATDDHAGATATVLAVQEP